MNVTIDGQPITVADWEASTETDEGDRTFTGKLRELGRAEQGAPLVAWRRSDSSLWSGTLDLDPWKDGDLWSFRASGGAAQMTNRLRLLYRHDGGDGWEPSDGDPYNTTFANEDRFDLDIRPGRLKFFIDPVTYAVNDRIGVVFWAEGASITRYSYVLNQSVANSSMEFLIRQSDTVPLSFSTPADGDATKLLNTATGTRVTVTLDGSPEVVAHLINCNTITTPGARRRFWATGMRVYGRTIDDAFSLSDVVSDVAGIYGFPTDIQSTSLPALPLDWTEDHAGLLDYMAEQADWRWMLRHDGLTFGPYDQTWDAFPSDGGRSLQPERRSNRARVPYRTTGGQLRWAEASASDDPFPGREFVIFAEEMEDPQPDDTVPLAYAQNIVDYEASARLTGTLDLSRVRYRSEARSPADVEPGMLLNLPDLGLPPQRIRAVTYRGTPDGGVTGQVEIGTPFNVIRSLADAERDRPHIRRRRRRHRRRPKPAKLP